ncbi:MAG: CbtA family protein [Actinomycetota bacterium]
MVTSYILRGLLAGAIAGAAAFGFARAVGEPQIARAIALEEASARLHGDAGGPEVVSRRVQTTFGLATGLLVTGAALGGLFSLAFAGAYRRLSEAGPRVTSLAIAGAAFVAVFLVPFLKYPGNPPAVGDPATIGRRTALYFVLIAFSLAGLAASIAWRRRLLARVSAWNASLIAVAAYLSLVAVAYVVLPGFDEVAPGFPASLLWRFRVANLGIQAVLWAAIGLAFGALTERSERGSARSRPDPIPVMG